MTDTVIVSMAARDVTMNNRDRFSRRFQPRKVQIFEESGRASFSPMFACVAFPLLCA